MRKWPVGVTGFMMLGMFLWMSVHFSIRSFTPYEPSSTAIEMLDGSIEDAILYASFEQEDCNTARCLTSEVFLFTYESAPLYMTAVIQTHVQLHNDDGFRNPKTSISSLEVEGGYVESGVSSIYDPLSTPSNSRSDFEFSFVPFSRLYSPHATTFDPAIGYRMTSADSERFQGDYVFHDYFTDGTVITNYTFKHHPDEPKVITVRAVFTQHEPSNLIFTKENKEDVSFTFALFE